MVTAHPSAFGALLKRYRMVAGLTQEELAERARLSARAVSDLERGVRRTPYRDTVQQLAEALGLGEAERAGLAAAARRTADRGEPAAEEAAASLAPTNLPDEPTPFIGRQQEISQIASLLHDPHIRLVTLTGPGGTGKTRLALQIGFTLLPDFADGVFFVDLAPLADSSLVSSTVAEVLGVKEEAGKEPVASLIDTLRDQYLLLVLDNFEHLLDASSVVSSLLDECRRLHVLVTSRIPLHLSREHEHHVPPLLVPDPHHLPPLEHLSQYEAVALFSDRARAARDSFSITNANAPAVAQICYQLDGLPLAIELAAARTKLFPPQALLSRLSKSLPLLTGGAQDKPTRQQTLRGTIDWSYSLLPREEQTLFARLSVFAGGWTFEAADAVCNSEGRLDVLEGLGSLVDQSLVRQEGEDEPRFSLLDTIREYAAGKLDEEGEGEQTRRAHAEYMVVLAEEAGREPSGSPSSASLDHLDAELSNVRAALQWAHDQGDVGLGLRLAVAMTDFWEVRGLLPEGRRRLQDLLADRGESDPRTEAGGFKAAMRLASAQQDWLSARDWGQKSLAVFQELGDRREMADVLNRMGGAALYLRGGIGDLPEVARTLEDGLVLARETGDRPLLSHIMSTLAWVRTLEGDLARAGDLGEESLELSHDLDDVGGMVWSLDALLTVAEVRGDLPRARGVFAQYVALLQRPDFHLDPAVRAEALRSIERLAFAARGWGDYAACRAVLERVMELSLGEGDVVAAAHLRAALALFAREEGRYEQAIELLDESLTVFRASEDLYGIGRTLLGLSDVARDRGDGGTTISLAQESLGIFRKLGNVFNIAWCLNNLAVGAFQHGDHDRADVLLQEALTVMLHGGGQEEFMTNRGLVALAREEYDRAAEHFAGALHGGRTGNMLWLTPAGLDGMAMVAAGVGQVERAARLFGAADALRRRVGRPVLPANRFLYDRYVAEGRNALGGERFAAAWQEGEALSFGEALTLALGEGREA